MEHGTQKLFGFPAFGPRPGARAAASAAKSVGDAAVSAVSSAADPAVSALSSVAANLDAASSAPPPGGGGGPSGAMAGVFLAAGIIETFGGLALLLGLLTRPVAFLVAGECAVIFWWMHVSRGGIFPIANGGEAAVLFCFTFLYLVFAGPGAFAVDNLIWRRRTSA
jgi:putative oxidoreductase